MKNDSSREMLIAIVSELQKYVNNQKQVIEQLGFMVDKHTYEEEYELCAEYTKMKNIQEMSVYRLERILQGLSAFEEPINSVGGK